MKTVLRRLRRCFIGILIFSFLFILWSVWLGVSVNAVQKQVASNVGLLKDLATAGTLLREMGTWTPGQEQPAALESDCRTVIQAIGGGKVTYPEIQRFRESASASVEQMAAIRAQLRRPAVTGEEFQRQEGLFQAEASGALIQVEAAVGAVLRRQTELSIVLANKWTQMDCVAVISCLMAAVLALLFRSFQQTTAIRFNMQEDLERSEEQFRALFEDAPVAYQEMSPEGIVQRVNRAECALLGYHPHQIVGKPIWAFFADSCREASRDALDRKLAGEEALTPMETEFVREDGTLLILQMHASGIRNHAGEVTGIRSTLLDVTAHRRALRELQASEERWQLAARGSNDGLWDWNARTNEVFLSARWKEMLGFEAHELNDSVTEWESRVHPDDLPSVTQALQDHLDRKTVFYTAEYRLRAKDGSYRWILARGQALWDQEGRPTRLVGSHKDVTERRLAVDALRIAKDEAECASRAKGEFLANMSHEIRTPMTGVLGMIDLVLSTGLSAQQKDLLETARASADSLLSLLNDILDLSKIEARRLDLAPTVFSVRQLLDEAMRMFAVSAQEKRLSLTTWLDPSLPEFVVGDALRLRQILVNLAGNAIKFTDEGYVSVCARLETSRASEADVLFEVVDTGAGIPADKQRIVFDPFRQVDGSSTRRHVGSGLGLTISSRLVQLMGGNLGVKSEVGKGSTFFFTLPFPIAGPAALAPPRRTMAAAHESTRVERGKRKLRILLAEDNVVTQKVANLLLKREGHEVVLAGDGREAVAAASEGRFDLALMDVQMPDMDGLEATAAIRHAEAGTGRHLPIVAMTAHAMKGDREDCLAAGMDDYISKPFDIVSLRTVLEKIGRAGVPAERMTL